MTKITIHDAITKQSVTRDMDSAELESYEAIKVSAQAISNAKALNDAKVLSAKNKLKALGLTDAEVTALVG